MLSYAVGADPRKPAIFAGTGVEQPRPGRVSFGLRFGYEQVDWANLDFSTGPLGHTMRRGLYEGAESDIYNQNDRPAINVSIDGHGCNAITGWFRAHGAKFRAVDRIAYFSVSFEQFCSWDSQLLRGYFVYYEAGATRFSDEPLWPGAIYVKANHVRELRDRADGLRRRCDLEPFPFTDPVLEPRVSFVRLLHFTEVEQAVDDAYRACGLSTPTYSGPRASPEGGVSASYVADLRGAIIELEN